MLAVALGQWDVDGMAERMPVGLFREWRAYAAKNRLAFDARYRQARMDRGMAVIAKTIVAVMTALFSRRPQNPDLRDFMYDEAQEQEAQRPKTASELFQMMKTALAITTGKKWD